MLGDQSVGGFGWRKEKLVHTKHQIKKKNPDNYKLQEKQCTKNEMAPNYGKLSVWAVNNTYVVTKV